MKVRIGTRGSDLALWQANHVAALLKRAGVDTELIVLKTRGDVIQDVPLTEVAGVAFFTGEIEAALLEKRVDLAVHSHKDLPVATTPGLTIAAVPPRADPRERLLVRPGGHDPAEPFLPVVHSGVIGTSSPRRAEQVAALRPDLSVEPLRGNVPTRVGKLREGQYDAIVLAAAGLDRLELDTADLVVASLPTDLFVPAPAQGALAIQVRVDDEPMATLCREHLHDDATERAIRAERELLLAAGGGCNLPVGACVEPVEGKWRARAFSAVGRTRWTTMEADTPEVAARGAFTQLDARAPTQTGPLSALSVALCGSSSGGTRLGARLEALGARVVHEQVLSFETLPHSDLFERIAALVPGDVLAVTSRQTAPHLAGATVPSGVQVAAVGPGTARALEAAGIGVNVIGTNGASALARLLEVDSDHRVLFPCAEGALDTLERALAARGVSLERAPVYRTLPSPEVALDEAVDARVFMSPSSVRAALAWERAHPGRRTLRVALGPSTEDELRAAELVCLTSADPLHTLARLAAAPIATAPENDR
jgi:hydroxymethylbilane synthase